MAEPLNVETARPLPPDVLAAIVYAAGPAFDAALGYQARLERNAGADPEDFYDTPHVQRWTDGLRSVRLGLGGGWSVEARPAGRGAWAVTVGTPSGEAWPLEIVEVLWHPDGTREERPREAGPLGRIGRTAHVLRDADA